MTLTDPARRFVRAQGLVPALVFLAWGFLGTARLAAQTAFGFEAGVSAAPTQFYLGGHAELGPIVQRLWFRPNLEVGIGSSQSLVAINGDFAYFLPLERNQNWSIYVGGGPAADIIHHDGSSGPGRTTAGGGLDILLGLSQVRGFFTEIKVGALDSPSLKIGVGYTFRRGS